MDKKRVTLITYLENNDLEKVNNLMKDVEYETCKIPYYMDDINKRNEADRKLPYHFTMFTTFKDKQDDVLEIIEKSNVEKIKLKINGVHLVKGRNFVIYLGIEENHVINALTSLFYKQIKEEKATPGTFYKGNLGEEYDPSKLIFHLTLHVDTDKDKAEKIYEKIKKNFQPFYVEFDKLMLFDDFGGDLIAIKKLGQKSE